MTEFVKLKKKDIRSKMKLTVKRGSLPLDGSFTYPIWRITPKGKKSEDFKKVEEIISRIEK